MKQKYLLTTLTSCLVFVLLSMTISPTDHKEEIEKRIKSDDVPEKALEFICSIKEKKSKVKWYYEVSQNITSYEAKFNYLKKLHSVEFDSLGEIQDVEIKIKFSEIPDSTSQNIKSYFNNTFKKYNVKKTQLQLIGVIDDLKQAIENKKYQDTTIHYEIEFYGKNDNENDLFEGYFSADGNFLSKKKIILQSINNLNY